MPKATAKKKDEFPLASSDDPKPRRVGIHGKPGSGKSTLAATLSSKCPLNIPPTKKTYLPEVLWVPFDTNATSALKDIKLKVDEVPMADLMYQYPVIGDLLNATTDYIFDAVENKDKTIIVLDTLTKLDKMICRWWEENGPTTKSGARDSFAIWRNVPAMHERFHTNVDLLEVDVVSLFHSKPHGESDSAKKKAKAGAVAGTNTLAGLYRFDFMYEDAVNIYRRDLDFILVTECKKLKNGKYDYAVYTDPQDGFEAKSRFRNSLPEGRHKSHLRKIYEEVEKS